MLIIFRQLFYQTSRPTLALTIIILALHIAKAQECQPFNFQTDYTKCKLTLNQCIPTPQSHLSHNGQPYFQFKNC